MAKQSNSSGRDSFGSSQRDRKVWSEFGETPATERAVPDLPPNQQNVRIQVSRKGRGGKTVTVVTGFQHRAETLTELAKKLKAQCGSGGTAREETIEIQGDHAQKMLQILVDLGYKAKISGGK
jgi:translation initiation factor 1